MIKNKKKIIKNNSPMAADGTAVKRVLALQRK